MKTKSGSPANPKADGEGSRESGVGKWTPGPWLNVSDSFIQAELSGKVIVEEIGTELEFLSDDEITANANLIASAPEIYGMLSEVLDYLKAIGPVKLCNPVRALLAKARGESSPLVREETGRPMEER